MGAQRVRKLEDAIDTIVHSEKWVSGPNQKDAVFSRSNSLKNDITRYLGMAQAGDVQSQRALGDVYAKCGPKGQKEAVNWWRKAAEQGDAESDGRIAAAYASGSGVDRDYQQAFDWWKKVAESDFDDPKDYVRIAAESQRFIGHLYMEGKGFPVDDAEAYYWYSIAADNLNVEDSYSSIKEQTNNFRNAVAQLLTQDRKDAVKARISQAKYGIYKRAERGDPDAQLALGLKYYHGIDVPRDVTEGVKWLTKAANQGYSEAQRKLGLVYVSGQEGAPSNPEEAIFWLETTRRYPTEDRVYKDTVAKLTPDQVNAVHQRVKDWKPIISNVPKSHNNACDH